MNRPALIVFLLLAQLGISRAHAACTTPAGKERDLRYNSDFHTYQFCNGTTWISAGGVVSGDSYMTGNNSVNFGNTNSGGSTDSGNGNLLLAQPAALSHGGTLQSLSFYVTVASGHLRLGIYDNSGPGGRPGAKMAETAEFVPVTGWNTVNVVTPVTLTAGTYWLAYLPELDGLQFQLQGTTDTFYQYSFTYGPMPATFSTTPNTGTHNHWSFYATLNTTGCTNPTGSERKMIYNTDFHTYQFCNGDTWVKMGAGSGGGGGGCSSPTGKERTIIYNTDFHTYQFCNGTNWVKYGGGSAQGKPNSANGYFVMSKSTWNGNLGDVAGADAKCLTELTTNTGWKGYADANARGLLVAAKVKAFIYGTIGGGNNLNANTTYYFANANDSAKGGARFTTDPNTTGPGDYADWSQGGYFGGTYTYWSGRGYGVGLAWGTSFWSTNAYCNNGGGSWTDGTSAVGGSSGNAASGGGDVDRWYDGGLTPCNTAQHLVCFVNP